jgi:hypothetical protein
MRLQSMLALWVALERLSSCSNGVIQIYYTQEMGVGDGLRFLLFFFVFFFFSLNEESNGSSLYVV